MYNFPKIQLLDNLTGKWAKQWSISWFFGSLLILTSIFFTTTERTIWDVFYLGVSIVGLCCVISLSFRKNTAGNGLGIIANIGEAITQGRHGATGLLLFPLFAMFTHLYGLLNWAKAEDDNGNMIPKSESSTIWLLSISFVVIGLMAFPTINNLLTDMGFAIAEKDGSELLGISFYWINIIAFVLAVTAQTTMILRYSFSWWLWIASNMVWIMVNLMTQNYIFAAQMMIYQVNAFIGLYGWYSSSSSAQ